MTPNDFDLIRLVAATQVMLVHAFIHMPAPFWVVEVLYLFPGVPVFFFVSGFLIYRSYDNACGLGEFAKNRGLRIYPALLVCFVVSVAALFGTGYLTEIPPSFGTWTLAQLTVVQFYNPDFLRGYGVGVLNGVLWTISVELQFYALTPIIHRWLRTDRAFIVAIVAFMVPNVLTVVMTESPETKLLGVTFIPWVYMFLFGAFLSRHLEWIPRIRPYALPLLLSYLVAVYVRNDVGNHVPPPQFILLALAVLGLAYSKPTLSDRLLVKNDISYGMYIYHMPVFNTLLYLGATSVWLAVLVTVLLGVASWLIVERPSLHLKRVSVRSV